MIIQKFDMYRDGGTISMICRIGPADPYFDKIKQSEIEICLDGRFGKCPSIWIGYPDSEGSILIEDKDFIKHIISEVEYYKRLSNYRMDSFINYEQIVRDWKIKNVIDEK